MSTCRIDEIFSEDVGPRRSVDEMLCRICQCGPSSEELLSPCQCKGTLALVHRTCLEIWLGQSNRTKCEICRTPYDIQRTTRSFIDWLRNPSTLADRRNMIADCICFTILLPLSVISSWLCVTGATHYLTSNTDGKAQFEAIGLIVVTVFLELIFLGWLIISIRYHCAVWREWRDTHYRVCLLHSNQSRPRSNGNQNQTTSAQVYGSSSIHRMTRVSMTGLFAGTATVSSKATGSEEQLRHLNEISLLDYLETTV